MSVEVFVDANGAESVFLVGAPKEATSPWRRNVSTGGRRRGNGCHRHVGNDGHQEQEDVLHDRVLERAFSVSERCFGCSEWVDGGAMDGRREGLEGEKRQMKGKTKSLVR